MATFDVDRSGKEIKHISSLMNLIKDEQNRDECKYGAVWMRGVDWSHRELLPTIGREYCFGGVKYRFNHQNEKDLLHRFRRFAYEHLQRPITNWEALFLARHHGLRWTPLSRPRRITKGDGSSGPRAPPIGLARPLKRIPGHHPQRPAQIDSRDFLSLFPPAADFSASGCSIHCARRPVS